MQDAKSINAGNCDLPKLEQIWRVLKASEKNRKEKSSFTFTKWLNLVNHPFPRFLAFLVIIRTVDRFSYIVTALCVFVFGFNMFCQVVESYCLILTITARLQQLSDSLTNITIIHTLMLGFKMIL